MCSICAGAGVYVSQTQRYAGRQAAQPNNTYLSIYSGRYSSANNGYIRFDMYCCSNQSSSSYIGSFADPYSVYTGNFRDLRIDRYSSSSTYAGCIRLYGYEYYSSYLSYNSGVYTCNIPDSNGQTQRVNFALFGYNSKFVSLLHIYNNYLLLNNPLAQNVPTIYRFQRTRVSNSVLTLTCETRTAPPAEITWQRNGVNLTVDGSIIQMTQTVTNRPSSYFTSTISISDDPDNIVGTYRVIVGSSFGQTTSGNIFMSGVVIPANMLEFQTAIILCLSVLQA